MSDLMVVKNLRLYYRTLRGIVRAVDGVDFTLNEGETVAILGESGSGKTSLAKAIIRYLPRNVSEFSGSIVIDGIETMGMPNVEFDKKIRWKKISYVSQAAINSLNPVMKIIDHMIEPLILNFGMEKEKAIERARDTIKKVGISEDFLWRYPFELSGGMRQRIVISIAIISNPKIVILDEPTSALDVMTQANIINLLKSLRKENNLSYIFITHDISTSSELADRVAVMYAGQVVEFGKAETIYTEPLHPYSKGLLSSVPRLRTDKLPETIRGSPPSLIDVPPGCRFRPRCPFAMPICEKDPPIIQISKEETVRCWLYDKK